MDEAPSLKKLETVAGTNGNGFPEEAQGAVEVNGVRFGEGSKKARRRDILDKVLAALEPGEWGSAAILQVRGGRGIRQTEFVEIRRDVRRRGKRGM